MLYLACPQALGILRLVTSICLSIRYKVSVLAALPNMGMPGCKPRSPAEAMFGLSLYLRHDGRDTPTDP
jgi:hypothetical protein